MPTEATVVRHHSNPPTLTSTFTTSRPENVRRAIAQSSTSGGVRSPVVLSAGSMPASRSSFSVGSRPVSPSWSATASSGFSSAAARVGPCVVTPVSRSCASYQSSSRQRRTSPSWPSSLRVELATVLERT